MVSFNNDYSEVCHPKILARLNEINVEQNPGYTSDKHTEYAVNLIKKHLNDANVDVHFVVGGTQANLVCLSSILKPFEAVIACETGHILVHETGAIEATGHKICIVKSHNGKVIASEVEKCVLAHNDEHMVKPRVVFISNATELGTFYSLKEIQELRAVCDQYGLFLYMDGARLGSAICAQDSDLPFNHLTKYFDVFYIGGTKNGAIFGEAIVIVNPILKKDFRFHIKQRGALLAKGFTLAIQFSTLFEDNLFFDLAKHANEQADKIRLALQAHQIPLCYPTTTNQIFPILHRSQYEILKKKYEFSLWEQIDSDHVVVRLVTSWATTDKNVLAFIKDISSL